jgi:hypothetical protein
MFAYRVCAFVIGIIGRKQPSSERATIHGLIARKATSRPLRAVVSKLTGGQFSLHHGAIRRAEDDESRDLPGYPRRKQ